MAQWLAVGRVRAVIERSLRDRVRHENRNMVSENRMENNVKTLPFRGREKEWREWSVKFLARAYLQGYQHALTSEEVETDVKDDLLVGQKPLDSEERLNAFAHSTLLLCCEEIPFSIVESARSVKYKFGDTNLAWKLLKER